MYEIIIKKDGETVFNASYDKFEARQERGIIITYDYVRSLNDIRYNGHQRMTIQAWSGCFNYESFQTDHK